jgi:phosphoglycolate phosphatase-like HAD superfamily hydrolase
VRVLALDFDGVIAESAPEAFVVALRAWVSLRPASPLAPLAAATGRTAPGAGPEAAPSGPLYRRFLDLMPLGNRAEDYGVAMHVLEQGIDVPDQAAWDAVHGGQDPAGLLRFHERFYEVRHAWLEADPAGWRRLLPAYPALLALLRRRQRDAALAIATAKDRRSVDLLLADYGIADLFPPEQILDKEEGVSKRAHLTRLRERLDVAFEDITFVDDKLNHLESVASLGVRGALAAWGYNGERERTAARRAGFLVCSLDDAESQLFPAPHAGRSPALD